MNDSIEERIALVRERIAEAARRAGRSPAEITLVAVTKTHPAAAVAAALAAGVADMGENRVQEAGEKIAQLAPQRSAIRWHLIGHLQRNKARQAVELFGLVHSLDSLRLAEALSRYAGDKEIERRKAEAFAVDIALPAQGVEIERRKAEAFAVDIALPAQGVANASAQQAPPVPRPDVLLQVNVSGEASKEGFDLPGGIENRAALPALLADVERIVALPGLRVRGLMTVAPWGSDPEEARPTFRALRLLRDELAQRFPQADWSQLSMGMTDDFAVAIEEGATIVRVGRALFGQRG